MVESVAKKDKVGYVFKEDVLFSAISSLLSSFSVCGLKIVSLENEEEFEVVVEYSYNCICFVPIEVEVVEYLFSLGSFRKFVVSVRCFEDCISYVVRSEENERIEVVEFRYYVYNAFEYRRFVSKEYDFCIKFFNKSYELFKDFVRSCRESFLCPGGCVYFES